MPRSFSSSSGLGRRPDASLFAVHRLPEKDKCGPDEPEDNMLYENDIDSFLSHVDNLLETDSPEFDESLNSPNGAGLMLPPSLMLSPILDDAKVWGNHDPSAPVDGVRPPALFSGCAESFRRGS